MPAEPSAYGVLYTPDNATATAPSKTLEELLTPDIAFVRVQWVDYTNVVRFRVLSASYFRALFSDPAKTRPGIGLSKVALGIVGISLAPGFGPSGEYLFVPDLRSWRVCTYAPAHASVMGWFQEKSAPRPGAGLEVPLCPRSILARLVKEAQDRAGVSFLVGVESEFILLKETTPEPVFACSGDWSTSVKFRTGSAEAAALEEIARCLVEAGIELQMYHAEAAPGQYEVITGPLAALEAADAVVFTRETIYNIAHKHGFNATFSPRLHNDSCGNGAHTHISVHGGTNTPRAADASRAATLTPTERSFLQGVLTHLPAICALTLPNAASYARMLDGIWSGGTYACWGTDNREVPLRLCGPAGGHHLEVKCVDGTATPHLVFAGLIAAGLRGIVGGEVLATGDCAKAVYAMSITERRAVGLENAVKLPQTIQDARASLGADVGMKGLLGEEFVETYLSVNELMEKFMTGKDEKETVKKIVEYF